MDVKYLRRTTLKMVGTGVLATLSGCSGTDGSINKNNYDPSESNLTIDFKGDPESERYRSLLVLITEQKTNIINGDTEEKISLTTKDGVYFQKYIVQPEITLKPSVFVREKGKYHLIVWVEERGTINTDVKVDETGKLAEKHNITISSTGMGH